MSLKSAILSTSALVVFSSAAAADVTAKDIWADWQDYMSSFGYSVDGTETMAGDTLSVSDIVLNIPMPEEEGEVGISIDKIEFIEVGDGTVRLVLPTTLPIVIKMDEDDGPALDMTINYTTDGMNMLASGDPSKITYTYSADAVGMALANLVVDGKTMDRDAVTVAMNATALKGATVMEPGTVRRIVQGMTLGATTYTVNFTDPEDGDKFELNGKMDGLNFDGTTNLPKSMDPDDMASAFSKGFSVEGGFGYTGSAAEFAITDEDGTTNGSSSSSSAKVGVKVAADALHYTGNSTDLGFKIQGGQVPMPVEMQLGSMGFNFLMPVAKSDTASDFGFGLTLADFVTSDAIWSMIDPGAVLPRDPATIAFDLTGKAKMLFNMMDPEEMEAVEDGDAMPAELEALTLQKLLVSIAGAKLTGTGDFTFDNTDTDSFDGFPKPTGSVDLMLEGGMGLMDKLVEMGLLPQEQAMGARMMLGLFARPGPGEDTLTSKIEINEQGHIRANDQRIQ